ncbi:MAG TPA: alpha/beta fold hydrolase [Kofleriaceae bacterium]|nr:alpha/beta fold hydrolase [Kofleriaceae bacterium]
MRQRAIGRSQVHSCDAGVRLLCTGPERGPALVCLPCAGGSATSFRELGAALPPDWRLIAIDPPGHGLHPGPCLDRIEDMVEAYLGALAGRLRDPYYLLGHSMGGLVAYLMALRLQPSLTPPRGVFICAVRGPTRLLDEVWSDLPDAELAARLERVGGVPDILRGKIDDLREFLPAVRADFRALERFAMPPAPGALRIPTWILAASDDPFVTPARVREWTGLAAQSQFVELPRGGHFFHQTSPRALARVVEHAAAEMREPRPAALEALRREIHVWMISPEAASSPARLTEYLALLSADERARHRRYLFENSRRQFLIGHALLRTTLSRYVDRDPGDWQFTSGAHGRPDLVDDGTLPPLRFNISHTDGLVVVAVGLGGEIGIDVEDLRRTTRAPDFAAEFLAGPEREVLAAAPPADRPARFFELWTLKESYLKARGLGLSLPLDSFWFRIERARIVASFLPAVEDDPETWQFMQTRPTDFHVMAVAARRPRPGLPDLRLRVRRALLPLDLDLDADRDPGAERQPALHRRGPW